MPSHSKSRMRAVPCIAGPSPTSSAPASSPARVVLQQSARIPATAIGVKDEAKARVWPPKSTAQHAECHDERPSGGSGAKTAAKRLPNRPGRKYSSKRKDSIPVAGDETFRTLLDLC